jgi:mannose/cellobiose epimerase-like protein (N-acyl-D-glucosamine 2-epimerase family)
MTTLHTFSASDTTRPIGAALLDWLVHRALPMWSRAGIDRQRGGYFEKIDLQGRPVEAPRRTRVVARQVYVFATAVRRGWAQGADEWVDHGLNFLLHKLRLSDGTFASSVQASGAVVDATFDLYEHAFVLFALASACRDRPDRAALRGEAEGLLRLLRSRWAHPAIGFEEAAPRSLPLRANPHMHLLEAALAWVDISRGDERIIWAELADELANLCLARLIDRDSGALRENFDGDWRPMPGPQGRLVEPGHQFEWGWLLLRWAGQGGSRRARVAAMRLLEIGEAHGVDPERGVAVNALDDGLRITDAAAKLWPQTERVKAWHQALAEAHDPARAAVARQRLSASVAGLTRYLLPSPPGLWQEQMRGDGGFDAQDCRASSLYHIVCAIDTLQDTPRRHSAARDPA